MTDDKKGAPFNSKTKERTIIGFCIQKIKKAMGFPFKQSVGGGKTTPGLKNTSPLNTKTLIHHVPEKKGKAQTIKNFPILNKFPPNTKKNIVEHNL